MKLTEPQEDRQTIEKMRRDVMLMSSDMEKRPVRSKGFRLTGRVARAKKHKRIVVYY